MDFSRDFYWHDAVIKNIIIDRNNPGIIDEIWLDIVWPKEYENEDDENEEEIIQRIVFEDVFLVNMYLNFGHFGDNILCSP